MGKIDRPPCFGIAIAMGVLLLLSWPNHVSAQGEAALRGQLVNARDGQSLANATILLLEATDSTLVEYTITGTDGNFVFGSVNREQAYLIKVSSIGYASEIFPVTATWYEQPQQISLRPYEYQLEEVIVRDKPAIRQRGDTLSYDAERFRDSTERKLGELLQNMPGIAVSDKGDVTVHGKAIRTMLIDGDDITGNNYRLLTQNLSADLVESVDVIFHYLDNPLLSSFFASEDIALNIRTQPDKRRKLNGDVSMGVGTRRRYDGDGNLIGLYDRLKSISFVRGSNIGVPLQYLDSELGSPRSFAESSLFRLTPDRLSTTYTSYRKEDITRLNYSGLVSSSLLFKLGKNWKLNGSLNLPYENFASETNTTFNYPEDRLDRFEAISSRGKIRQRQYTIAISGYPTARSRLEIRAVRDRKDERFNSRFARGAFFTQHPVIDRSLIEGRLTKKLGKNTLVLVNADYLDTEQEDLLTLSDQQALRSPLFDRPVKFLRQESNFKTRSFSLANQLLWKIDKSLLFVDLSYLSKEHRFERSLAADVQFYRDGIEVGQSDIFAKFQYSSPRKGFTYRFSGQLGSAVSRMRRNSTPENSDTPRRVYMIAGVELNRAWSSLKEATWRYTYTANAPSVPDYADFARYERRLSILHGNPDLLNRIALGHLFNASYRSRKVYPYFAFDVSASLGLLQRVYTVDYTVVDNITISSLLSEQQPTRQYTVRGNVEKMFDSFATTLIISPSIGGSEYRNYLNGIERGIANRNLQVALSLKSGWDSPVNLLIGTEHSYVATRVSTDGNERRLANRQSSYYVDPSVEIGEHIVAKFSTTWLYFHNRNGATSNSFLVGGAITYLPAGGRYTFQARVHNLLNAGRLVTTTEYDYLQIVNENRILSRYLLLAGTYRF